MLPGLTWFLRMWIASPGSIQNGARIQATRSAVRGFATSAVSQSLRMKLTVPAEPLALELLTPMAKLADSPAPQLTLQEHIWT